jgi:DNA-binding transcriptional regulator YhcF (GntR family)
MSSISRGTGERNSTRRLKDYLRANFYLRNISPGDKLVSHRELSKQLHISPTTALRLYEELESEGLLASKERSGTFLKHVGIPADRGAREVEMFRIVRDTAERLKVLNVSSDQFTRLLLHYMGAGSRDDFKFGFVAHREAYELAAWTLRRNKLALSLVQLSPDPEDANWTRAVLAKDKAIRCVIATYLHVDLAISVAREFDRHVLMARPERISAKSFFAPPDGRTRYVLARDPHTAEDIRRLLGRIFGAEDASQFIVASLEDEDVLREMEVRAEEIIVSPMARTQASARFGPQKRLKSMPVNLSDDTIHDMLFHYLFS